jgi:hypothetical protein
MNRLIRKKHERIQASVQRYEESHGYRKPESVEDNDNIISTTKVHEELDGLSDRELLLQIYDMLAAQQEQIDSILKMTGSGDDTGTV